MSLGITIKKADIDAILGGTARSLLDSIYNAIKVRRQMEAIPDAVLLTIGYTSDDVVLLRNICADMRDAGDLFAGMAAAGAPGLKDVQTISIANGDGTTRQVALRDFSAFLNQVAGVRG
jgi:hypothetical protein